jgi:hypothetical protein
VIAAETLDGQDLAVGQHGRRRPQRITVSDRIPRRGVQGQLGAAGRTADRLGVEAPVGGVVIFGGAGGAQREAGHGGEGPVVGHAGHDGEAGTAVGAVGERVAVPTLAGVEHLEQAGGARGDVGRHQRHRLAALLAVHDLERRRAERVDELGRDRLDDGQRRRLCPQRVEESLHQAVVAFDLDEDTPGVVAHEPAQAEPRGQPVDERAVPDSLDNALHPHPAPDDGGRRGHARAACTRLQSTW